jgi:hypothetical protein
MHVWSIASLSELCTCVDGSSTCSVQRAHQMAAVLRATGFAPGWGSQLLAGQGLVARMASYFAARAHVVQ